MARPLRAVTRPSAADAYRLIADGFAALADALDQEAADQAAQALVAPVRAMPEPEWYSLKEAARLLRLDVETLRRMVVRGEVPGRRYGRTWRVPASALREQP